MGICFRNRGTVIWGRRGYDSTTDEEEDQEGKNPNRRRVIGEAEIQMGKKGKSAKEIRENI